MKVVDTINMEEIGHTFYEVTGMSKGDFRLYVLLLIGALIIATIYKLVEWISSFSLLNWLTLILLLIGEFILRRQSNLKKQRIEKEKQKQELARLGNLNKLKTMDPFKFEKFVCNLFRQLGHEAYVTKGSGDGGKDIMIYNGGSLSVAECKRYVSTKVTRPEIQKFHSAIIDCNAEKGYFITTGEFTKQAVSYVHDKPIELINGEELVLFIEEITTSEGLKDLAKHNAFLRL